MSTIMPTIDSIKKTLEEDYQATHGDQVHLFRYVKGNLHELRVALEKECETEDWDNASLLCNKIEALAINLLWDELRQAASLLKHVAGQKDAATFKRLLKKLDTIVGATFA